MPELPVDVAVANRFISSLSKSLQALCHGCMDFDSGIEIVGYININIDSGSKVDYVLNEKVLKSTTNSMTFVSNSFLARKEPNKQTRDGACSPIPEISQQAHLYPGFESRGRSYLAGMHARNMSLASSQQSERKRSWPGMDRDWRANKRLRGGRIPHPSTQSRSFAPGTHSTPRSSLSSRNLDPSYTSAQSSTQASEGQSAEDQLEVNIKKELYENNPDEVDRHEHDALQPCDPETCNGDQLPGFTQIKSDPDGETAAASDETVTGAERLSSEANNDFKDTFLAPSTSEDNDAAAGDEEHADDDKDDLTQDDASDVGQSEDYPPKRQAAPEQPSDDPADLEESREEGNYSQPAYSETGGEGSSDRFEVIEIDDEDEDVQAMFGETRGGAALPQLKAQSEPSASSSIQWSTSHQKLTDFPGDQCKPFCCGVCGRGFQSLTGFNLHMQAHEGRRFLCPVCDSRFNQKVHLKTHLKGVHKLVQCLTCSQLLTLGSDFNHHVLHCPSTG